MHNINFLFSFLIAQRGYFNDENGIPENSIPAFKKALRYGYAIELDVRLTKDKKIVVFHDDLLTRACGVNKIIENLTYKELLKYNLFDTKYKIPLFSEVLNLIDGKVPILIETKTIKFDGELEKILSKILDNYKGDFSIQSFNPFSIYWLKKNRPNYVRGLIMSNTKKRKTLVNLIAKSIIGDIFLRTNFISYNIKGLPNSYIEKKKKKKIILGWTIKNKENYSFAKKYCDNMICNNMEDYIK